MTKLREQMIHEMALRRLAPNTQRAYLQAITQLARHYHRSPDQISKREVKAYLLYLHKEAKRSTSTCNVAAAAMRFFYHHTLGRSATGFDIPFARKPKKLPQVLSREEVARLVSRTPFRRHRVLFLIAYSAGLRVSEIVKLRPSDIDSDRMVIRLEQGKGGKDRLAVLSPRLLEELRAYWRKEQPGELLFSSPLPPPPAVTALPPRCGSPARRPRLGQAGHRRGHLLPDTPALQSAGRAAHQARPSSQDATEFTPLKATISALSIGSQKGLLYDRRAVFNRDLLTL